MTSDSHINRFFSWSIVAFLYGLCFFIRISPNTLQHSLQADLLLTYSSLGWLSASFYYAYSISQLLGAILSKKVGLHRAFCLSFLFLLLGVWLFSHSSSVFEAIISRALMGVGSSLTFIFSLSVARRLFAPNSFPIFVGFTSFFGTLGALCAQTPLEMALQYWPWKVIFQSIFWGLLALGPVLVYIIKPWVSVQDSDPLAGSLQEDWLMIWHKKSTFFFFVCVALTMMSPMLTIPEMWGELYLSTLYTFTPIQSSFILSFFFVGVATGSLSLGFLSKYHKFSRFLSLLLLGESLFLLGFLDPQFPGMVFMSACAWGIGFCASGMLLFFSLIEKKFPNNALSTPLFNMSIMLGSSALQPIVGRLLDHFSPILGLKTALIFSFSLLPAMMIFILILWICL